MININLSNSKLSDRISAVRVQVKLINAVDEELVNPGLLNLDLLRVYATEALIDTEATRTVIPTSIV